MEKYFSRSLGGALVVLTLAGFAPSRRPKHFLGLMNTDEQHSLLRIPLTLALLYGASQQTGLKTTRAILAGVGGVYLAMGAAGLVDRRVDGLLPSRLTGFDIGYHFVTGGLALWYGVRSGRMLKP